MDREEMMKMICDVLENSDIGRFVKMQLDQMDLENMGNPQQMAEMQAEGDFEEGEPSVEEQTNPSAAEDEMAMAEAEAEKEGVAADRRKYARLEQENHVLRNKLLEAETRNKLSSIKTELLSLEQENIKFDFAEEMKRLSNHPNPEDHIATMRKHYQRFPINVNVKTLDPKIPSSGRQEYQSPSDVYKSDKLKGKYTQKATYDTPPER